MHRLRPYLLAGVLALAVVVGADQAGALDAFEHDSVDLRFELRPERTADDLVVVAIDDVTFSDLGEQWPFPRTYFAKAVERLHEAGAREIVLDVQFTEASDPDEDLALYEAIDRAGGAVLATSETDGRGGHNIFGGQENLDPIGAVGAAANLPDQDSGVIRRFNDVIDGLPSIAAAVARREGVRVDHELFNGETGAYIDYRGGPEAIRTVSFSDLYQLRADPEMFAGKIVVIGASAPTLQDVHPTPTARSELMAGAEIQANAIWTALNGLPLRDAPGWVTVLAVLFMSFVVPLTGLRLSPIGAALVSFATAAVYVAVAWIAFVNGIVIPVVAPLLAAGVSMSIGAVAGQMVEGRARRRITEYSAELEAAVRERTADLDALQLEIIERLGQAVDSRDEDTGQHINRIGLLSYRLARAAGMDEDRAEMLRRASALHDVGKIAIPDAILQKPGKLTPQEWEVMKTHTTAGAKMLSGSRSPLVRMAEVVALTHHERWDGQGYPHGIAGEDIPLEGRIVAVCDVFDALCSRRPYKEAWTPEEALAEIERCAGTHFDPALARMFVELMAGDGEPRFAAAA